MENQLKTVPTKTDLNNLVTEIRDVKETIIRNTDRIDTLYDMRKEDRDYLHKRVKKLIDSRLSNTGGPDPRPAA